MADGSQTVVAQRDSRVPESEIDQRIAMRPVQRTEALVDEICNGLRIGLTLQQICRRQHMPHRTTVWEWRKVDSELAERISRARAEGCEALAEQSLAISDDRERDALKDKDGNHVSNHAAIARDKLRVDTRLKLAALWDPKNYGAKQQDVTVTVNLESLVLSAIALRDQQTAKPILDVTPSKALNAQSNEYDDLI